MLENEAQTSILRRQQLIMLHCQHPGSPIPENELRWQAVIWTLKFLWKVHVSFSSLRVKQSACCVYVTCRLALIHEYTPAQCSSITCRWGLSVRCNNVRHWLHSTDMNSNGNRNHCTYITLLLASSQSDTKLTDETLNGVCVAGSSCCSSAEATFTRPSLEKRPPFYHM